MIEFDTNIYRLINCKLIQPIGIIFIFHFIIDYDTRYWLSEINTQCIDNKSDVVVDKLECRIAFADMLVYIPKDVGFFPWRIEHNISDQFSSTKYPTGCIAVEISERGKEISIRWNESPSGQSSSSAYQVCKIGITTSCI